MKVGDLVKFKSHTIDSFPLGVVISTAKTSAIDFSPAYKIAWCCKHTSTGYYQANILEVVDEVS